MEIELRAIAIALIFIVLVILSLMISTITFTNEEIDCEKIDSCDKYLCLSDKMARTWGDKLPFIENYKLQYEGCKDKELKNDRTQNFEGLDEKMEDRY